MKWLFRHRKQYFVIKLELFMHIAASSVVNSQTKPYFTRSSEFYKPIMKYSYESIQGSKYLNLKT